MASSLLDLETTVNISYKHISAIFRSTVTTFIRNFHHLLKEEFIGLLLSLKKESIGFNYIRQELEVTKLIRLI